MIDPRDMEHCREAIRHGSLSFHTASRLLPASVRDPALALYAFCRLADDAVDEGDEKTGAVLSLRDRLDLAYQGRPRNAPADRAFAAIIEDFEMPRALPEALLEGLAWDAMGKRYQTLPELYGYSARVASAVGAMMCVLMGERQYGTLARACDLGLAMQLTNIARDVGEDARARRMYLPIDWLYEAGLTPEAVFANPTPLPEIRRMVARLLADADRLYFRSEAGLGALPLSCRPGIYAARFIYAGIGRQVRRNGCDSVTLRARTTTVQKLGWLMLSMGRTGIGLVMPGSAVIYAPPIPEVAFLVDAAARDGRPTGDWGEGRSGTVLEALATLEARDRARRAAFGAGGVAEQGI
ncbi:MAG: phytoene/squalene synthase family protein [Pseudomonadota bacterium]